MSEQALAKRIFLKAIEQGDPALRAAFKRKACAGNPRLEAAVDRLLGAWTEGQGFLEEPAARIGPAVARGGVATVDVPSGGAHAEIVEGPGSTIGPYKLLERLGEGGMGVVYMAEQERPVRRRVALKVIKLGMDTRQFVARFEAERQALAMMDHPSIARVLDAGATETGRPYFVMELVRGSPITDYCDKHKLPTRERLELFISVCQAVQHAHHKGIIHRDLKPSNILVALGDDGKPAPKVIDFGIAKALHQRLTEKTLFTEHRQLVGTPQYMSPEQAEADAVDVDTRTDVYALGVLLYELLTGTTPIDPRELARLAIDRMREVIREREPPRPSTRLSTLGDSAATVAGRRGLQPAELSRLLRGELDWVVMKAIEKDRTRRYETPIGLARDIERYLADEPVEACPPSRRYRMQKLIRKHRRLLAMASAFAAILVAAASISIWQAIEATEATDLALRREAEALEAAGIARAAREAESTAKAEAEQRARDAVEAAADTRAFAEFLSSHVLAASRPEGLMGGVGVDVRLAEALEKAEPAIPEVFAGSPAAEAITRQELGITWRNLGRYAEAERNLRRALEIHEELGGKECMQALETRYNLGATLVQAGRFAEAVPLDEENLRFAEARFGHEAPMTLAVANNLGTAYCRVGRMEEGIRLLEEALELAKKFPKDPANPGEETIRNNLATVLLDAGRVDDAERAYRETIAGLERYVKKDDVSLLQVRSNLARLHFEQGDLEAADRIWSEVLPAYEEKVGADHIDILSLKLQRSNALLDQGRPEDAARILEGTLPVMEARLGKDHRLTLDACANLAWAYRGLGRNGEALRLAEARAALSRDALGAGDDLTLELRREVARSLDALGRTAEAAGVCEELLEGAEANHGKGDDCWIVTAVDLAWQYVHLRRYMEAEKLALEAIQESQAERPRAGHEHDHAKLHPIEEQLLRARAALATALWGEERSKEALPIFEEVLPLLVARRGPMHGETTAVRNNMAVALVDLGRFADAVRVHEENLGLAEKGLGRDNPETIRYRTNLARAYLAAWNLSESLRVGKENLALAEGRLGPDHELTFEARVQVVKALQAGGRWADAEPLARANVEQAERQFADRADYRPFLLSELGRSLLHEDKWREAEEALRESVETLRKLEPEKWPTFESISCLGGALLGQGKLAEAAPLLVEGYRGMVKHAGKKSRLYSIDLDQAIERIARLFELKGRPEDAARWRAKMSKAPSSEATRPQSGYAGGSSGGKSSSRR